MYHSDKGYESPCRRVTSETLIYMLVDVNNGFDVVDVCREVGGHGEQGLGVQVGGHCRRPG